MARRICFAYDCKHIALWANNTRLVLTEVETAVVCDNQMEQVNTVCMQNAETWLKLKGGVVTYTYAFYSANASG